MKTVKDKIIVLLQKYNFIADTEKEREFIRLDLINKIKEIFE